MAPLEQESTASESQNESQLRTEFLGEPSKSACEHFREYSRERPEVVALWCLGIGFVLGWELKLW